MGIFNIRKHGRIQRRKGADAIKNVFQFMCSREPPVIKVAPV